MDIAQLKLRLKEILARQRKILDRVEDENRELTSRESREYRALEREFDSIKLRIEHFQINGTEYRGPIKPYAGFSMSDDTGYRFNVDGTDSRDAFDRYLLQGVRGLSHREFQQMKQRAL